MMMYGQFHYWWASFRLVNRIFTCDILLVFEVFLISFECFQAILVLKGIGMKKIQKKEQKGLFSNLLIISIAYPRLGAAAPKHGWDSPRMQSKARHLSTCSISCFIKETCPTRLLKNPNHLEAYKNLILSLERGHLALFE